VPALVTMQSAAMSRNGADDRAGHDAERSDEEERRQMTALVTMQSEAMRRNGAK
jgi:hypothetical protein